jgi:dihydrofolate reductase
MNHPSPLKNPLAPRLTLVVARSTNGVIGRNQGLPWNIPEDLRHFRQLTTGHAILMGRRTWESIGRALPNRRNLVLSHDLQFNPAGAQRVGSLAEAITLCADQSDLFVIGGAQVYASAQAACQRAVVTEVDLAIDGDAFFASLDPEQWQELAREPLHSATGIGCTVVTYQRRGNPAPAPPHA